MRHLPHSVEPLALIALRETGAGGCAISAIDPKGGAARVIASFGLPVPAANESGAYVTSAPLDVASSVSGTISFVFRTEQERQSASPLIERAARSIEAVWRLTWLRELCVDRAAQIGELQAELADSKIGDRARGLLDQAAGHRGAIETMQRHIETVLRASQSLKLLERTSQQLEEELAERKLSQTAKSILMETCGMSEEEAHLHLRSLSRKGRRPLKAIAQDLIDAGGAAALTSGGRQQGLS